MFDDIWRYLRIFEDTFEDVSNIFKYLQASSNIVRQPYFARRALLRIFKNIWRKLKTFEDIWIFSNVAKSPKLFKYVQIFQDNFAGLAGLSSGYLYIFQNIDLRIFKDIWWYLIIFATICNIITCSNIFKSVQIPFNTLWQPGWARRAFLRISEDIWKYLKMSEDIWKYLNISGDVWWYLKYLQICWNIFIYVQIRSNIIKYPETTLLGSQGSPRDIWKYLKIFGDTWNILKYLRIS